MIFYRCKCGEITAWGSMPPAPCEVCDECGTTMSSHPDYHSEPIPHDWIKETTTIERELHNTITKIKKHCIRCGKREIIDAFDHDS